MNNKTFLKDDEYFHLYNLDEDGNEYTDGVGLDFENRLYGEVDYSKILNFKNIDEADVESLVLVMVGKAITHHYNYDVYSLETGEFIYTDHSYISGSTCYPVDLKRIYEATGSANFRIEVDDDFGSESFFAYKSFVLLNEEDVLPKISSIEITTMPQKTKYVEGDKFDKKGMVVTATYNNGNKAEIKDYTIYPETELSSSNNKITVFYQETLAYVDISVGTFESVVLTAQPVKKLYVQGQRFNATGMIVSAKYSNNVLREITDYTITPNAALSPSDKKISVTYEGKTTDLNITVLPTAEDEWEKYNETPNLKELSLGDKAKGYLNLSDGKLTTVFNSFESDDFVLPLNITHLHKITYGASGYGENWRLNLNRRLIVSEDDTDDTTVYTYVDEMDDEYTFKETYYYINDGAKCTIDKSNIKLDMNGNLSKADTGEPVYRTQSCKGFTLIPEINDFIDSELIEQKQSEHIQLEEYVKSYEMSFANYIVASANSGDKFGDVDISCKENFYESIKNVTDTSEQILLTKSEALQLKSLYNNKEQSDNADEQISLIISQSRANFPVIKAQFTNYLKKKAELEQLNRQTPVRYIKGEDGIINGFNADGNLVCMYNSFGQYVMIEYNGANLITGIYDSNSKTMDFEYVNGLLNSITDNRGRKVEYCYDDNQLSQVNFTDSSSINFEYNSNRVNPFNRSIKLITSNNGANVKLTMNSDKVKSIECSSKDLIISKEITTNTYADKVILSLEVKYSDNNINFSYNDGSQESYTFYSKGRIKYFTKTDCHGTTQTYTYSYAPLNGGHTATVLKSSNSDRQYEVCTQTFNEFNQIISKQLYEVTLSGSLSVSSKVDYKYDYDNKLIEEKTTKTLIGLSETKDQVSYVKYYYNAQGSLTITESYVEGEELTSGKIIEERVYDEYGNVIKTISWNTLDSSTKFYTENEFSENGQVIAEKDETGENSAEYEYVEGTNVVNSVKLANGGKLAYGRNSFNNDITSVTHSTESGESNTNDIVYNCDLPVEVKSGNTKINYTYDYSRRISSVSINDIKYADFSYTDYSHNNNSYVCENTTSVFYNGDSKVTVNRSVRGTDSTDFITGIKESDIISVNNSVLISKQYNAKMQLTELYTKWIKSSGSGSNSIKYTYDNYNNLLTAVELNLSGSPYAKTDYAYNEFGNVCKKTNVYPSSTQVYTYSYKNEFSPRLEYVGLGDYKFYPLTDVYGRNTGKEIFNANAKIAGEYISYRKVGDHGTNMPSTVWYANGKTIKDNVKYKYDKSGNISEIRENGALEARYLYDSLNRLIREDNKKLGKTCLYDYDNNGNITTKRQTTFTLRDNVEECDFEVFEYVYEGDRLISYNGERCEYNGLGSPTTYRGKTLNWRYGKILLGYGDVSFSYDGLGRRLSKSAGFTSINYYYDNDGNMIKQSNGLEFVYDNGGVTGFKHGGENYFYRKDAQGNIAAILDSAGEIVVRYHYDAWGNHEVLDENGAEITDKNHIGNLNPFRYRGYYYDTETGLYYLQTRYYDPETGRFISQDSIEYADPECINGLNLYAYCGNNPVMFTDETGTMPNWLKWLLGGLAFVGAVVLTALTGGALAPVFIGMAVSIVSGAIIQGVVTAVNGGSFWQGFLDGAADGALWGGIFAFVGASVGAVKYSIKGAQGALKGTKHLITITKGQKFVRYGSLQGRFITDVGTEASKLALPATNNMVKVTLQATKNFRVYTGIVAPLFGEAGGGVQYVMRYSIETLIKKGWLFIV